MTTLSTTSPSQKDLPAKGLLDRLQECGHVSRYYLVKGDPAPKQSSRGFELWSADEKQFGPVEGAVSFGSLAEVERYLKGYEPGFLAGSKLKNLDFLTVQMHSVCVGDDRWVPFALPGPGYDSYGAAHFPHPSGCRLFWKQGPVLYCGYKNAPSEWRLEGFIEAAKASWKGFF